MYGLTDKTYKHRAIEEMHASLQSQALLNGMIAKLDHSEYGRSGAITEI